MGRVLPGKTVAVDIINHISSRMKKNLLTKIIEGKCTITLLADKSVCNGQKSTLIVFLKDGVNFKVASVKFFH